MLRTYGDGLFGEQHGAAPARVLSLPGWMRTRSDAAAVLGGLDAIALDLPGFGGASPEPPAPPVPVGSPGYAALVAPVLDACTTPVVLLGHSFGARVALHVAAAHPQRIGGLVLTGAPFKFATDLAAGRPPLSFRAVRWLHRRGVVSDARMEALRRTRGSADYNAASAIMRPVLVAAVNEDYTDQLAAIRAAGIRVELVHGDADTAAPLAGVRRATELLGSTARLTEVPGGTHFLPSTHAAVLREAVERVLA